MGFGEHGWESLDPSRSDIVIPRRVPDEMRSNEELTARPSWDRLPPMKMLIHVCMHWCNVCEYRCHIRVFFSIFMN